MRREPIGRVVYLRSEMVPSFDAGRPFVVIGHTIMGYIVVRCTNSGKYLPHKLWAEVEGSGSWIKTTDYLSIGAIAVRNVGGFVDAGIVEQARMLVKREVQSAMSKGVAV